MTLLMQKSSVLIQKQRPTEKRGLHETAEKMSDGITTRNHYVYQFDKVSHATVVRKHDLEKVVSGS